jgi:Zn-dependent protease
MESATSPLTTEEIVARLRAPQGRAPWWRSALLLAGSLAAFVLVAGEDLGLRDLALLIGVLLLHESGHWIGMRAFGYRDVRMFFIPFFGAAVSGTPSGVAPYKQGIVLLLGPVPGIVAAVILARAAAPSAQEPLGALVSMLAFVNGVNLLPLEPFDGGRLAHLAVASRFRVLDVASLVVGAAGLAFLAFKLGSWPLGVLAYLGAVSVPIRVRAIRASRALREGAAALPERIEDAPDETLARLVDLVRGTVLSPRLSGALRDRAALTWCRDVYDRARGEHAGPAAAAALILAQGLALVLALGGLVPLYAYRPGEVRPLTRTAASPSGRVRAHYPVGFKVAPSTGPDSVTLTRVVGRAREDISLFMFDNAQHLSMDEQVAALWKSLSSKDPSRRPLSSGAFCHGDRGRTLDFQETTPKGWTFRHTSCLYPVGDRTAAYEITLPERLYDADAKVLADIAEAAEITP